MSEIGKINIDFQILKTHDPKVILIADTSDWKHIADKTSVLEITMPGGGVPRELIWNKHKINIVNSSTLGITPKACDATQLVELPDGVYTIAVKGEPNYFCKERFYLRTERLELEVGKLYLSLGVDFDKNLEKQKLRDDLLKIDSMIKAANFATMLGELDKTAMYFKEAQKRLKSFCKSCN